MATNEDDSPLLSLPVELVGCIVDSLEPESLLMLCSTCKVLEHSKYDQFAKTFFERRFCCIYYEPRWLLIKAVLSSRLGSRIRFLEFTVEPFEGRPPQDLHLAPSRSHFARGHMAWAQLIATKDLSAAISPQTQISAWPSLAIFNRVFRDVKAHERNLLVKFNFAHAWSPASGEPASSVRADVLVAAVTAGIAIDTLDISLLGIHYLCPALVLVHLESDFVASFSISSML
jgi:hypothetical protein